MVKREDGWKVWVADTDNKLSNPYDSNYDIFSKVPCPVSDVNANSDMRRTFKHNNMGKIFMLLISIHLVGKKI